MYKIVIAEDDEILLEGISTVFDWCALGISVVASVDDGEKAFSAVKENGADILLTDIKMVNVDGLELIERIKEENLDVQVVIMSAYDDFSFAQRALRLGVEDYLLKPIDLNQLTEIMKHIVYQKDEKSKKDCWNHYAGIREEEVAETFFWNILKGKYDRGTCKNLGGMFAERGKCWQVIEIVFDSGNRSKSMLEKMIETAGNYRYPFLDILGKYLVCCYGESGELHKKCAQFKENIREECRKLEMQESISFYNGTIVDDIYDLNLSYRKVLQIEEYRFVSGKEADIFEKDLDKYFNQNHTINRPQIEYLVRAVLNGNKEAISECIERLKEDLRNAGCDSLIMLLRALSYIFGELGTVKEYFDDLDLDSMYRRIISQKKLDQSIDILEELMLSCAERMLDESSMTNEQLVHKACAYIDKHYGNSKLRITEIASEVGLTPNYLSTIFKKITGDGFSNYLMKKRMEEAQFLLIHSSCSSQEIGYRVGFDNPSYFSTAFKKYTGVPVSKYRDMVHS